MSRRGAVFLDRDGTVIADKHYLSDPDGVEILPGAAQAIARLNARGVAVFLVTNQSGIGRGMFTQQDFGSVQERLISELAQHGAHLDGVYFCPHSPDEACACRKPAPGLFERAAREHDLDLSRSVFIGDRLRDVEPAFLWGGTPILVRGSSPDEGADRAPGIIIAEDLDAAVELAGWPGVAD